MVFDAGDDLAFYVPPRLVTHIDQNATSAPTDFYPAIVPKDGPIFDKFPRGNLLSDDPFEVPSVPFSL